MGIPCLNVPFDQTRLPDLYSLQAVTLRKADLSFLPVFLVTIRSAKSVILGPCKPRSAAYAPKDGKQPVRDLLLRLNWDSDGNAHPALITPH
jgi:hypothetical protein